MTQGGRDYATEEHATGKRRHGKLCHEKSRHEESTPRETAPRGNYATENHATRKLRYGKPRHEETMPRKTTPRGTLHKETPLRKAAPQGTVPQMILRFEGNHFKETYNKEETNHVILTPEEFSRGTIQHSSTSTYSGKLLRSQKMNIGDEIQGVGKWF